MVSTRSTRKRDELEDAHSQTGQKRSKQRHTTTTTNFSELPSLVLENIFLFLDNTRDVYNFSQSAKCIRDCLTPKIVVRSAVFGGDEQTKAVVRSMVPSLETKKSIYVPSTRRLLRLCLGTTCERGVRPRPFGLVVCPTCAKEISSQLEESHHQFFTNEHRNRLEFYERNRILSHPVQTIITETAGETVGPLVLAHQVKLIGVSYGQHAVTEQSKQALDQLFGMADQRAFSTNDTTRAKAIVDAFQTADGEYYSWRTKKQVAATKRRWIKQDKLTARQLKSAQTVYGKLQKLLCGHQDRDLVLKCTWSGSGRCHFDLAPIDILLGDLVRVPSKAKKKTVTAAIKSVRQVVALMQSYGLFVSSGPNRFCFLTGSDDDDDDGQRGQNKHSYEKCLYEYCLKKWSSDEQLEHMLKNRILSGRDFVKCLQDGKPFDALLGWLDWSDRYSIFLEIVQQQQQGDEPNTDQCSSSSKLRKQLAGFLWRNTGASPYHLDTEELFRTKFERCHQVYQLILSSIEAYLADPQTVAFLQETGTPSHRPNQTYFTRQEAVDRMYGCARCIHWLEERDFASLLDFHRATFMDPSNRSHY